MGAPVAQLDDARLSRMFVRIAREAFMLAKNSKLNLLKPTPIVDAVNELKQIRARLSARKTFENAREWVRTEAESALFWAYRSPAIEAGRYAYMDVGAGTTNASWFHLTKARPGEESLSFYGAACSPPGCDAIDSTLCDSTNNSESVYAIRGRESELIERLSSERSEVLHDVFKEISDTLTQASIFAFEKERDNARWKNRGRIFFFGGGAKINRLTDYVIERRKQWLQDEDHLADPGVPSDLFEESGEDLLGDPNFLLVAYGLAHRLPDVPPSFTPGEIIDFTPKKPRSEQRSWRDLYSD